jgi:hypothetical protein
MKKTIIWYVFGLPVRLILFIPTWPIIAIGDMLERFVRWMDETLPTRQ